MFRRPLSAIDTRIFRFLLVVVILGGAAVCRGQARVSYGMEQVATFDGYNVEVRYTEDRGRQGSIHAAISMLNIDGAKVIANNNSGSEQGDLTLECKDGADCVTGSVKYTGMIIVGEGEKLNTDPSVAAPSLHIDCPTVSECEAFLGTLKEAAANNSRQSSRPRTSKDKPADEPVIDGSKIPSQINFNKNQASSSKPEARDESKPLFDQLGRQYLRSDNTGSASETEKLTSLFDSLPKQSPEIFTSQGNKKSPLEFYTPEVEKYAAGLFDEARQGRLENFGDPLRSVARQWFTDRFDEMTRNTASRSLTGKSFDELPQVFRKDYSVWEAGVKRIFQPFSLRGGFKLVDAFG